MRGGGCSNECVLVRMLLKRILMRTILIQIIMRIAFEEDLNEDNFEAMQVIK